jgi:hypothetical protein
MIVPAPRKERIVINDHVEVGWEETVGETAAQYHKQVRIYVDDKPFLACSFLLVSLTQNDPGNEDVTIEDLAERPGARSLEGREAVGFTDEEGNALTENDVLWGHASALQAWVEHDYKTMCLHANLSFPLLKELARVGDKKAKRVLRFEIHDRLKSGYPNTVITIIEECAALFDGDDWQLVADMLRSKSAERWARLAIGRQFALSLATRHAVIPPSQIGDVVDALIDLYDSETGGNLADALQHFDKSLSDQVAARLSDPAWDPLTRRNVALYTSSPDILEKLIRNGIKKLDQLTPSAFRMDRVNITWEWSVIEKSFGNKATPFQALEQGLKAILKKDMTDFDKADEASWLELELPAIEAALNAQAATPELVRVLFGSTAMRHWLEGTGRDALEDLLRQISTIPAARGIPIPLLWIHNELFHDLHLLIDPQKQIYRLSDSPLRYEYMVRDQNGYGVFACNALDDLIEYLGWTGLSLPPVFAGATLRSRIERAAQDAPRKVIRLGGKYTRHSMGGNVAGLRAFAKEKGLRFTRLLDNGRYTSAYHELGHVYYLNTNYGREEWVRDAAGAWKHLLPAEKAKIEEEAVRDPW